MSIAIVFVLQFEEPFQAEPLRSAFRLFRAVERCFFASMFFHVFSFFVEVDRGA